jgi:hypothetical protein
MEGDDVCGCQVVSWQDATYSLDETVSSTDPRLEEAKTYARRPQHTTHDMTSSFKFIIIARSTQRVFFGSRTRLYFSPSITKYRN